LGKDKLSFKNLKKYFLEGRLKWIFFILLMGRTYSDGSSTIVVITDITISLSV
jgi:hypothetical protein